MTIPRTRSLLLLIALTSQIALSQDLSGSWIFRSETNDGVVRARLTFEQQQDDLRAVLHIDNHQLAGVAQWEKGEFTATVRDVDPNSPDNWVRLTGKLSGADLVGTWTNSDDSGTWTATRDPSARGILREVTDDHLAPIGS